MPVPSSTPLVYVGLGSNLGHSVQMLRDAAERLRRESSTGIKRSSLWGSAPVNCPPGSPDFLNAVVEMTPLPHRNPASFLNFLQGLEKEFGRQPKKVMNEARPLDLDILMWGDLMLSTDRLVIPHPRGLSRRFVLEPLAELAPELVWPGTERTVETWRAALEATDQEIRCAGLF